MKFRKNRIYHVVRKDHCSFGQSWQKVDSINDTDLNCETVGYLVKETKSSIFIALSKYEDDDVYCSFMQILKKTIIDSRMLK